MASINILILLLFCFSFGHSEILQDLPTTNVSYVQFWLYTRQNPDSYQVLEIGDLEGAQNSFFDLSDETKILVHGYTDSAAASWVRNVRDQYLSIGEYNIIAVDWEELAGPAPFYFEAAENTKRVGQHIGDFVNFLVGSVGTNLAAVHPIGFSLGAQVVGHLGHYLNGEMDRITGLDPAGFLFHTVPASEKLSRDDAKFVDVIHSAGLWVGTDEMVGHVDFYPNSGMANQPGSCETENFGLGCSHQRGPKYFAESIVSPLGFEAVQCGSYEDFLGHLCDYNVKRNWMGHPADRTRPGIYYLDTNSAPPYAKPFSR